MSGVQDGYFKAELEEPPLESSLPPYMAGSSGPQGPSSQSENSESAAPSRKRGRGGRVRKDTVDERPQKRATPQPHPSAGRGGWQPPLGRGVHHQPPPSGYPPQQLPSQFQQRPPLQTYPPQYQQQPQPRPHEPHLGQDPSFPHAGTEEIAIHDQEWKDLKCEVCKSGEDDANLLLCDYCNLGFHMYCLRPPLEDVPDGNWFCEPCSEELLGSNTTNGPHSLSRVWGSLPNLLPMPRVPMSGSLYEVLPSETFSVVDWAQFKLNLIPPPVSKVDSNTPAVPHTPRMFLLAPTYRFPMFPSAAPHVMRFISQRQRQGPAQSYPPQGSMQGPGPVPPSASPQLHASSGAGQFQAPPPPRGRGRGIGRPRSTSSSPAPSQIQPQSPASFEPQSEPKRARPQPPQAQQAPPAGQYASFPPPMEELPLSESDPSASRLSLDRVQVTPLRGPLDPSGGSAGYDSSMSYLDSRQFQDF